ncbi:glycoside hydrolase family 45 protein [Baudoinia panamericana UAMH 10762]|uniref:Glycoside hydrolase family 45 protein n=1 Tax=Baudoinia panamericana (strain UAMH 10762) TaxID=717646 RepID=M2N784_BAUPA|nr:glycoside hydrolase family 45 protein [Baudoinia panamericana UAMH 10762]EMC94934.1 glycoside hydrolase family 45 protein [Baudoinia panamericana UAMH 10762]
MLSKTLLLAAAAASVAMAQNAAYSQCGGQNWSGSTTCVAGYTCQYQNAYYSQCLPSSSSATTARTSTTTPHTSTTTPHTSTSTRATTTTTARTSTSTNSVAATGVSYKASFTEYGAGDTFGSPNCQTDTAACGFYTSPGYSAAVSQNLFGVGPGAGAGPACGTCWRLTIQTDSSGNPVSNAGNSIVVMVNNLCPASGNPLCSQNGLSGTNQYGANVNFDTCIDSGASAALFGNSGVGLGIGTATQVSCSQYSGTVIH